MNNKFKCSRCGDTFPSEYWFKAPSICINCYPKLSDQEKAALPQVQALPTKPAYFPTVATVLLIPVWFWVLTIVLRLILFPFRSMLIRSAQELIAYTITFACILLFFTSMKRRQLARVSKLFVFSMPPFKTSAMCLLITAFTFVALSTALFIVSQVAGQNAPMSPDYSQLFNPFHYTLALVLAPVFEEILFRGLVLDSLLRRYSPTWSILLTCIAFAFAHEPVRFVLAFILGLVISWVYWRTGSIIISILMHFFWNLVPIISLTIAQTQGIQQPNEPFHTVSLAWLATIVAVALILAYTFLRQIKRSCPMPNWRIPVMAQV